MPKQLLGWAISWIGRRQGNPTPENLFPGLNALRDLLREGQIAVGISCLDGSFNADSAIAEGLGSFGDHFTNAQATGWIGWINRFNLGCAFDGSVSQPPFFARDSL